MWVRDEGAPGEFDPPLKSQTLARVILEEENPEQVRGGGVGGGGEGPPTGVLDSLGGHTKGGLGVIQESNEEMFRIY